MAQTMADIKQPIQRRRSDVCYNCLTLRARPFPEATTSKDMAQAMAEISLDIKTGMLPLQRALALQDEWKIVANEFDCYDALAQIQSALQCRMERKIGNFQANYKNNR